MIWCLAACESSGIARYADQKVRLEHKAFRSPEWGTAPEPRLLVISPLTRLVPRPANLDPNNMFELGRPIDTYQLLLHDFRVIKPSCLFLP